MHRIVSACVAILIAPTMLLAGDAEIVASLKAKGAEAVESKGALTGLSFRECAGLTGREYEQIHQLSHLKSLSFGKGFSDAALKALGAMPELETLSTNGMEVSDAGLGALADSRSLRSIAIFHPGKGFTGAGLTALGRLPHLERLTVAGSVEFADAGLAAAATLGQLKELRTWHSGVTLEGMKKLPALKQLASLTLGQRLAQTPPATLSDGAVAALADCSSLEALTLQEARLSLSALGQLKKLSKLKRLTLDGIDIPEADIVALKNQLAGVDVRWTAPTGPAKQRIDALFGAASP